MTIRVLVRHSDPISDPTLEITLTGLQDLKKFQILLNRALKVAPEFGEDWFQLCDKLTEYLEKVSPT